MKKQNIIILSLAFIGVLFLVTNKRNETKNIPSKITVEKPQDQIIGEEQKKQEISENETILNKNAKNDSENKKTDLTNTPLPKSKEIQIENKNCNVIEYRHTTKNQKKEIEDYLELINVFQLSDHYNPKTLCVKVNQKAVHYKINIHQGKPEVIIQGEVGPESVVRISYCTGKVSCKEKCEIKAARFMDQLMDENAEANAFKDSWSNDQEQKKKLQDHASELRNLASENKSLNQLNTIREWETITHQESFCKK